MQLYGHLKPPDASQEARKTSGRVRMEMMGGNGGGRRNMPQLLVVLPAEQHLRLESKAESN